MALVVIGSITLRDQLQFSMKPKSFDSVRCQASAWHFF